MNTSSTSRQVLVLILASSLRVADAQTMADAGPPERKAPRLALKVDAFRPVMVTFSNALPGLNPAPGKFRVPLLASLEVGLGSKHSAELTGHYRGGVTGMQIDGATAKWRWYAAPESSDASWGNLYFDAALHYRRWRNLLSFNQPEARLGGLGAGAGFMRPLGRSHLKPLLNLHGGVFYQRRLQTNEFFEAWVGPAGETTIQKLGSVYSNGIRPDIRLMVGFQL